MSIFGPSGPAPVPRPGGDPRGTPVRRVKRAGGGGDGGKDASGDGADGDSVEVHGGDDLDPSRRLARSGDEDAEQDRRRRGELPPAPLRPRGDQADEPPSLDLQG